MSWNSGKTKEGGVDWGYNLRKVGLSALDVLTRVDTPEDAQKASVLIEKECADDKAILARVVLFRVSTKLYKPENRQQQEKQDDEDIKEELKNVEDYYRLRSQQGA